MQVFLVGCFFFLIDEFLISFRMKERKSVGMKGRRIHDGMNGFVIQSSRFELLHEFFSVEGYEIMEKFIFLKMARKLHFLALNKLFGYFLF